MKKINSGTEPNIAPVAAPVIKTPEVPYVPPRRKSIERLGMKSEPYTRRWPQVRGGICEFCGVLDRNVPSEHQYKLCPHFRELGQLRCSYCDESKNPDDIIHHSNLNIAEHPDNPDKLIVWCNSYECSRKHEARFKKSGR